MKGISESCYYLCSATSVSSHFFTVSLKSSKQLSKASCLLPFTAAVSEAKRAALYKMVSPTHLHVIIFRIRLQY